MLRERYLAGGVGYGEVKEDLAARLVAEFAEPRERYAALVEDSALLDEILVEGNDGELQQVLTNLVLNAAEAMSDPGEIVIKFSHVTNTDKHPKGIAASLLEKRVNEEMNGKACMQVFPNSTLYDDNKVLEAMLNGDVQLAAPSLSKFEKFTKKFRIFDLPFMFKNIEAVDAFQASETGQAMKESMTARPWR